MTDNLIIWRVGRNFDFKAIFNIQMFAPCASCQVPHYRPRKLTVPAQKAAVSLACSSVEKLQDYVQAKGI